MATPIKEPDLDSVEETLCSGKSPRRQAEALINTLNFLAPPGRKLHGALVVAILAKAAEDGGVSKKFREMTLKSSEDSFDKFIADMDPEELRQIMRKEREQR